MKYGRSTVLIIAAALFLPPIFFPAATARAQAPVTQIASPNIQRFDLDPPERLVSGEALIFRITGTPRGQASVSIAGVKNKVVLREVMMGVYEGAYTIKPADRIDVDSVVTGHLRRGNTDVAAVLGQPLVDVSALAGLR